MHALWEENFRQRTHQRQRACDRNELGKFEGHIESSDCEAITEGDNREK